MSTLILPSRRGLLAVAGLLLAAPAVAAPPANGRLRFAVWRNGEQIGDHEMSFARSAGQMTVTTHAAMNFKIGPLPVRYSHQAREVWKDGAFQTLETVSLTNGKRETVSATASAGGVDIRAGSTTRKATVGAAPLSHWNVDALDGPLFNPQNGKLLKVAVSRGGAVLPADSPTPAGSRWSLRGQADIDNWYDDAGVWAALRGRLPDRSIMEYRRL